MWRGNNMKLCVLVQDHDGEGEVVDCFLAEESEVEEKAIEAGERIGGEWRVYVKEFKGDQNDCC